MSKLQGLKVKMNLKQYISILINFKTEDKQKTINQLTVLINENDSTYSPLALYFLIDNDLIDNQNTINSLFDELINGTSLDEEIKNLIIYKKGLFNSDFASESDLLEILNPIINSESIWSSHALYLMGEYFYSKNEKQKAKDFFEKTVLSVSGNSDIIIKANKRLNRDLGE
mgnify:CR=1 FL=1